MLDVVFSSSVNVFTMFVRQSLNLFFSELDAHTQVKMFSGTWRNCNNHLKYWYVWE